MNPRVALGTASFLALTSALAGCSSVPVTGTVRSALACTPEELGTEDLPLARALVVIECPSGRVFGAETDRAGRFTASAADAVPLECSVRVSKAGYEPRTYAIADVCASHDEETCFALSVSARLSPEREAEITLAPGLRPAKSERQTIAGLP